jgi:imidazolonepropionase-like amidohydrolase
MKKAILRSSLLACAAMLALGGPATVTAQGQQVLVIQGGTLIDGNGGAPIENSVIVVEGNTITAAGPAGSVQVPNGAQVIDASGKWITPGLVDAKANWNWQYGEAFLTWGVTSAMISAARNDEGLALRDAINHGVIEGPRLFQTVITIAGPGSDLSKENEYQPGDGDMIPHTSEETVEMVNMLIDAGADFITFADGDGPPEIFDAGVKAALDRGVGVVFRAMGPGTRAAEVCEMGDGIVYVHTGNVGAQIARDEALEKWAEYIRLPPSAYSDMDPAKVQPMVERLVACNAYLEPDLIATARGWPRNWARHQEETNNFFTDPNLLAYYPLQSIEDVKENVKGVETYLEGEELEMRRLGFQNQMIFLKAFVDAGGKIVAASDITQSVPGLGLHQEMAVFVEDVGMTPMQTLLSATSWVADGFKIDDIGRIQAGKLADILIVNADPLEDIMNLREIDTVIKDGEIVDRSYDPNYNGWIFSNNREESYGPVVDYAGWTAALKEATWRPNINATRGERGIATRLPDFNVSPTPGIEGISIHTVRQGSAGMTVTITGFNYTTKSVVYVNEQPVPTRVLSRTQVEADLSAAHFAEAGKLHIDVRHPLPLQTPEWGFKSNQAHILVPFNFTETTLALSTDNRF